jgi:putative transposase
MASHVPTKKGRLSRIVMRHERKISRLREFDYRQNGAYAITVCVHERRLAFGRVENGEMKFNRFGRIADEDWRAIPIHYSGVILDEWIVMPNHLHGILFLHNEVPPSVDEERELRQFGKPMSGSLSSIIGNYKSGVTRRIGGMRACKTVVWQRGFYEHIIRNERDLQLQREYIRNNPSKWADDELHM